MFDYQPPDNCTEASGLMDIFNIDSCACVFENLSILPPDFIQTRNTLWLLKVSMEHHLELHLEPSPRRILMGFQHVPTILLYVVVRKEL